MRRVDRREFLKIGAAGMAGLMLPVWGSGRTALASALVSQTPLPGKSVKRFIEPLPVFGPGGAVGRVQGSNITVEMHEVQQQILPKSFYDALPSAEFREGAWVWAYNVGGTVPIYPGVSVEARRGTPTVMTYVNRLPTSGSRVQRFITIDQTLHWANPSNLDHDDSARRDPYIGPPPAVIHLHGGEVASAFDGGPDQWFTPNGTVGKGYRTFDMSSGDKNKAASTPITVGGYSAARYFYPNSQQAATLWFHDHTLGATRINVYAGMAAFYLLRDSWDDGQGGKGKLPGGPYEREIAIQDRQFDTNGQLIFPDSLAAMGLNGPPPNPLIHPFWNPEFFGDVMVVNGKSWPYLDVEARRYRFRLLDGCNARVLELRLENLAKRANGPAFWVIGTDGGLLNKPVMLNDPAAPAGKAPRLLMAPGERYDVIIDFAGFEGQVLTLMNSGKTPFPNGLTPDPYTTGRVMEFRVGPKATTPDESYNPATGAPLRGGAGQVAVISPLALPGTNQVKRRLTLNEVMGLGGPVEALVNNTKFSGIRDEGMHDNTPEQVEGGTKEGDYYLTELPKVGDTELWEIVNLTGDTHPIHLHLVQFQILNRQAFNFSKYSAAYNASFKGGKYGGADMVTGEWMPMTYPAGAFVPAYGPPLPYNTPVGGFIGGNPDIAPFLQGVPRPPKPEEAGWKDTVQMNPGEVTRILVRFATQEGESFPFDSTIGPGYVWHCHIVDHEDSEMMRPYHPVSSSS